LLTEISLIISLQQPKGEEHQENQNTGGSKKKSCEELLYGYKQHHANSNQEINHIEENQRIYSFVHRSEF
jgi:hypothetical protein